MSDNLEKNISDAIHTNNEEWYDTAKEQEDDWYDIQEQIESDEQKMDSEIYIKTLFTEVVKISQPIVNQTYVPTNVSLDDIPWHNVSQHNIQWQDDPPCHAESHNMAQPVVPQCDVAQVCDKPMNDEIHDSANPRAPFFSHASMMEKITNPYFLHKISTLTVASLMVYSLINGNSRAK